MLTDVSMATKAEKAEFISKVSDYGSKSDGRKHIEIPKKDRDKFKSGDAVRVEKIE